MFARSVPGLDAAGAAGACALAAPALVCRARVNPVLSPEWARAGSAPCFSQSCFHLGGFASALSDVVFSGGFYRFEILRL